MSVGRGPQSHSLLVSPRREVQSMTLLLATLSASDSLM